MAAVEVIKLTIIDCDSDVVAIALWIIAIGFVILAIEKTTKLSNKPSCEPKPCMNIEINQSKTLQNGDQSATDEQQYKDILSQLEQLRSGIQDMQKDLQKNDKK
ncbi:hypothetical protein [Brevibacillus reuszeri]|uniref:hypothetical protein n=1 Tax=Brevibacillus reuszeri TaxID=54915 RepID=UPI0013DFD0FD|nr:hypothetical protein [Brevibacillus reuszeri]